MLNRRKKEEENQGNMKTKGDRKDKEAWEKEEWREREGKSRPRVQKLWKTRRTRGLAGDAIMATICVQSAATNFLLPIRH